MNAHSADECLSMVNVLSLHVLLILRLLYHWSNQTTGRANRRRRTSRGMQKQKMGNNMWQPVVSSPHSSGVPKLRLWT